MELSTRYDAAATEQKWYSMWESLGYFHADENSPKPPYCIVIPPPNITGILHMGHALNNTLQDALIRWKRMAGHNALWVPGTDHASIATQVVVERSLAAEGVDRHDLGREKFLERVWQWKEKHGSIIISQLKRLGSSCDWERERFTMDAGLSRAVHTVFKKLYDEGLIYKANYLINWCPRCLTTLSDDEVNYEDRAGKLWHLKYPIEGEPGVFAVVATTRPETMLGDSAVAVNPTDERYKSWIGKHAILPLVNRRIPIIADDFVDKQFGTGMVKITPAHDPNDYAAGKRHGLDEINILTPDARINDAAPAYEGLDRYEARKRVLADLEAQELVEKIEDYQQRIGHCYRCNTVIEPYVSLQWFVKMRPLAEPARKAVEEGRIRFYPKARERDYFHWLDNVRDWAISRQLWWGHRIPAWYCSCGEVIVEDSEAPPGVCPKCGSSELVQDPDVLDTWFSSALWPFSTLGWPSQTKELQAFYPTSVLVTAKDIIFFWVARMIMAGLHFMDDVPFYEVYFNPIVGDEHGKKMSKSKGNAIDPICLMEEYGTDALRATLCAYASREQFIAFSVKECEGYRNFMNKIWNAARLILMNTADLRREDLAMAGPVDNGARAEMALEDRWVLSRYARTVQQVNAALPAYEFDTAIRAVREFFWNDLCDYYLELVKPRLYAGTKGGENAAPAGARSRAQAQAMLAAVLEGTLRLLHPFCPFITEELWSTMREKWGRGSAPAEDTVGSRALEAFTSASIMIAPWNSFAPAEFLDEEAEASMSLLQEVIYTIRNIRGEMKIPLGVPASVSLIAPDGCARAILERERPFFSTLTNLRALRVEAQAEPPAAASMAVTNGITVYVELPSEMLEQEAARLRKELVRVDAERKSIEKKLSNEGFVSKAPPQVVQKEREKLDRLAQEYEQIDAKLQRLQSVDPAAM